MLETCQRREAARESLDWAVASRVCDEERRPRSSINDPSRNTIWLRLRRRSGSPRAGRCDVFRVSVRCMAGDRRGTAPRTRTGHGDRHGTARPADRRVTGVPGRLSYVQPDSHNAQRTTHKLYSTHSFVGELRAKTRAKGHGDTHTHTTQRFNPPVHISVITPSVAQATFPGLCAEQPPPPPANASPRPTPAPPRKRTSRCSCSRAAFLLSPSP